MSGLQRFRWYLGAYSVNLSGDWFRMVALQSLVLFTLGRSSAEVSWMHTAGCIAALFSGLFAGPIADRIPRRKVLIAANTAAAGVSFALGLLASSELISLLSLLMLCFAMGIVNSVKETAEEALFPDLIGDLCRVNANRYRSIARNATRVVFTFFAGGIAQQWGAHYALYLDAATFAVMAAVLLAFRRVPDVPFAVKKQSSFAELRDGALFALHRPWLRKLLLANFTVHAFGFTVVVILPSLVKYELQGGPLALGMLHSAGGIGAVLGGVLFSPKRHDQSAVLVGGFLCFPAALAGLAFSSALWQACLCYAAAQFVAAPLYAVMQSKLQSVETGVRGRVLGLNTFLQRGVVPFIWMALAYAATRLGNAATLIFCEVIAFLSALLIYRTWLARRLGRAEEAAEEV